MELVNGPFIITSRGLLERSATITEGITVTSYAYVSDMLDRACAQASKGPGNIKLFNH